MYIEEMIKKLEELKDKYGDLPVCVFDPDEFNGLREIQSLIPEPDDENPDNIHLV